MNSHPLEGELLQHRRFLLRLAAGLVGSNDAEDLVQDVWARVLEEDPSEPGRARAWLGRITRNLAVSRFRARSRRERREREHAPLESEGRGAEETSAHFELSQRVAAAVQALEEPYRSVVLLRYFEGLDHASIAARFDVPIATVRTRQQRALATLRERLDREFGGREAWSVALGAWLSQPALVGSVVGGSSMLMGWIMMAATVAALVVVAWWVKSVDSKAPVAARVSSALETASSPEPTLAPPAREAERETVAVADAERAAGVDERLAGKRPAKKKRGEQALEPKPGEGVLRVHITAAETGKPLQAVRAQLVPQPYVITSPSAEVDASRGRPQQNLRTDDHGWMEYLVPQDASYDLWIFAPDGHLELAGVPALRPDEQRELEVALPTVPDRYLYGRVVDAEDGRALGGARVDAGGQHTTTDAEGRFEVPTGAWRKDALTIALDGYESARMQVDATGSEPTAPRVARLHRTGSLEVRVLAAGEGPLGSVAVRVSCWDGEASFDVGDAKGQWSGRSNSAGTCSFEALPARVPLAIELRAGGTVLSKDETTFFLAPGEHRVELRTVAWGSLEGRVLDEDGQPVADLGLRFGVASAHGLRAKSDARGEFHFERVPECVGLLRIEEGTLTERESPRWIFEPVEVRIAAGASPRPVTVHAVHPLVIRGRVLGVGDRPCSARVWLSSSFAFIQTEARADGFFELSPLAPGEFEIEAQGDGPVCDPVHARAGDENVAVRLPTTGTVQGFVLDERGRPVRDALVVASSGIAAWDDWLPGETSRADGSFRFARLRPGSYRLIAHTDAGLSASLGPLRVDAGTANAPVELRLGRGAELVLLVRSDLRQFFRYTVLQDGQAIVRAELRTDEETCVVVPPGLLELRVASNLENGPTSPEPRRVELAAGEKHLVEFDLRSAAR